MDAHLTLKVNNTIFWLVLVNITNGSMENLLKQTFVVALVDLSSKLGARLEVPELPVPKKIKLFNLIRLKSLMSYSFNRN